MRLGTLAGTPVILEQDQAASIPAASEQRYRSMSDVLADWSEFRTWADTAELDFRTFDVAALGPAVPNPGQVVGVGLNYVSHLREAGRPTTKDEILPLAFTKFPASITGPTGDVLLHSEYVDWEVELVAVIGETADRVRVQDAAAHVAGYLVGQDLSDRAVQRAGQLSLGKSFRTYAPLGPFFLTADEVADPHDLMMRCWIDDDLVQEASTADMLYTVPELIALISAMFPLRPGDLLFTGTAAGVGVFRQPKRFLQPGEVLRSEIETLGEMRNICRDAPPNDEPLAQRWHLPLS